jgi:hypothetical protein
MSGRRASTPLPRDPSAGVGSPRLPAFEQVVDEGAEGGGGLSARRVVPGSRGRSRNDVENSSGAETSSPRSMYGRTTFFRARAKPLEALPKR